MSDQSTSLNLLHEIVEPAAASWWPPAPGWRILLAVGALLVIVGLLKTIVHWQRNRYRREALQLLRKLAAPREEAAAERQQLAAIAELLKRTALTAYPREQVATLTGSDWFAFLDRTGGTRFSAGLGAAMERRIYSAGGGWQGAQFAELEAQARQWIRQHKLPSRAAEAGSEVSVQSAADGELSAATEKFA